MYLFMYVILKKAIISDIQGIKHIFLAKTHIFYTTGFSFVSPQRALYKPKPPDPKALEAARQLRLKEIQMWAVIREIVFYAFFLWILMVISYKSISTESYQYKFSMEQVFILTNDTNHAFTKVSVHFQIFARQGL